MDTPRSRLAVLLLAVLGSGGCGPPSSHSAPVASQQPKGDEQRKSDTQPPSQDQKDPFTVRSEDPAIGQFFLLSRVAQAVLANAKEIDLFSLDPPLRQE